MFKKKRPCAILSLVVLGLLANVSAVQAAKPKTIDLNTASQAELEGLPGIGPALAGKIIAARPFRSVDNLKGVQGIGDAEFAKIKDLVAVSAARENEEPGKININTADKATLETLPGVGEGVAAAIIAARPFKRVDDLKDVKGIGDAKFAKIEKLVTIKAPKGKHGNAAELVDLNSAGMADLEALPGVGEGVAAAIIAARPFKRVDDLKDVKGIGEVKFAKIKDLVTIGEEEEDAHPTLKPGQTININRATQEQLEQLLGIGPVKAAAIIAARPYSTIEDIMKVKGIKEKTFAKIKDYIVVK
jgi:competence ComEA-like helix-hairpin-helix protein